MTLEQLIEYAESDGITVGWCRDLPQAARWYDEQRLIVIRDSLHPLEMAARLAHELGHAHYGHTHIDAYGHSLSWIHERQERQADRFAANLIINPVDYEVAERAYGPDPSGLAVQLETTRWIIEIWQNNNRALRSA